VVASGNDGFIELLILCAFALNKNKPAGAENIDKLSIMINTTEIVFFMCGRTMGYF
jgi:hypothetical protein